MAYFDVALTNIRWQMFHETKRWIRMQLDQDTGSTLKRTTLLFPMRSRYAWYISRRIHLRHCWKSVLPSTLWTWQDITRRYVHMNTRSDKVQVLNWNIILLVMIALFYNCFRHELRWFDVDWWWANKGGNLQHPVAVSYELPWWCHDMEIISVVLLILVTWGWGGVWGVGGGGLGYGVWGWGVVLAKGQ